VKYMFLNGPGIEITLSTLKHIIYDASVNLFLISYVMLTTRLSVKTAPSVFPLDCCVYFPLALCSPLHAVPPCKALNAPDCVNGQLVDKMMRSHDLSCLIAVCKPLPFCFI